MACLCAARLKASQSLGTLLSSKANQWTLLVGTIPIMFAVSATTTRGLPIDGNQRLELLITAAQSLFAVSILIDLRITAKGASALVAMSALYVVLAIGRFVRRYRNAGRILRDGIATPYSELNR